MLGIVHNGVAYPLVWEMLDKKGNSNSCERNKGASVSRMYLLDRFHDIFPDAQVAYLTGDRELVGKQWLTNGSQAPYRNALHGSEAPLFATCGKVSLLRRRGVVAPFYASGLSPIF